MKRKNILLACESSCDETAFSLYDIEKKEIIQSIILSQIEIHKENGGVVPELASRYHFISLLPLLKKILEKANLAIQDIDLFAATAGPGLPGALTLGFTFTKSLAATQKKPFIPVNHLEGHLFSPFLTHTDIPFPHLCLSLSGGHSTVSLVTDFFSFQKVGETRDDACGECFDKIAKLLNLPYPGGQYIEQNTLKSQSYENKKKYPISELKDGSISFSGLKTAVLYDLIKENLYDQSEKRILEGTIESVILDICSSTQYVIVEMIKKWVWYFLQKHPFVQAVTLVGGVACNSILRTELTNFLKEKKLPLFYPEKRYCCDNADMIAYVATKNFFKNGVSAYTNYDVSLML